MTDKTLKQILELPIGENNSGIPKKTTIKKYFQKLLETLWDQGESFSGKRPFGDSGWQYDLYSPLVKHKVVDGSWDEENDCIDDLDTKQANKVIFDLIKECFK